MAKSNNGKVYATDTLPSPLLLTAGPLASHQQIVHGLGYSPDPALTEAPPGFKVASLDSGKAEYGQIYM